MLKSALWATAFGAKPTATKNQLCWQWQICLGFCTWPEGSFMLAGFAGRLPLNTQDTWGNPCPKNNGCDWAVSTPENSHPLASPGVVVYLNPAQNTLQITTSAPLVEPVEKSIAIYTLTGQLALQTQIPAGEASKTISVAHLPAGIYFYVVSGIVGEDSDNGNNNGDNGGGMVLARGKVAVVR